MTRNRNDFTQETRRLFQASDGEYAVCWGCGANHADCLHHIFGRGTSRDGGGREGRCERSPLNAAPMGNQQCHLPMHGYWSASDGKSRLLSKTIRHLAGIGYRLTETDEDFLEKYGPEITRLNISL